MSADEIVAEYPYLTLDDIRAANEFVARMVDAASVAAE